MKIVGVKGFQVALPLCGLSSEYPVDPYESQLYRDAPPLSARSESADTKHDSAVSHFVALFTDEGIVGYGEVAGRGDVLSLAHAAWEKILGMEVEEVTYIMNECVTGQGSSTRTRTNHFGIPFVGELCALEAALWDAMGKKHSLPVYNLVGGKVREKVALAWTTGHDTIENCIEEISGAIADGFGTVTIAVGANDRRDIELLKQIRTQLGWHVVVRLGANGAWGDVTDAARILKRMEPYNPQCVTDALGRADGESYRRLREMTGVPICLSNQFDGQVPMNTRGALVRLAELVRHDAVDILGVDPSQTGGLLGFQKIAAFCEGAGIEVIARRSRGGFSQATWLTACITSGYSTSYAHNIVPTGLSAGPADDLVAKPLKHSRGYMVPPDGDGWGLEPDWHKIKEFCIGTAEAGMATDLS